MSLKTPKFIKTPQKSVSPVSTTTPIIPSVAPKVQTTKEDFPWRPNMTTETLKALPGELAKGVGVTASGAISGLTLGYVKPKFGISEQDIERFKVPATIADFATWLVPFGLAEKGVVSAIKLASKSSKAAKIISEATTKSPEIASLVRKSLVGGATFAGIGGLQKPEEGQTRLKSAISGGALGLAFPVAGTIVSKAIKPLAESLSKITSKTAKEVPQLTQRAITDKKGIIPKITPTSQEPVIQQFLTELKKLPSIRGKQETIYSAERSKRLGEAMAIGKKAEGEAGFYAQLGALKGEIPKVQFESIRGKIPQETIDLLFKRVEESPLVGGFEKITAKGGLVKMIGEFGGKVPTEGELSLLERVFGSDFVDVVLSKRPVLQKALEAGYQIMNIPRSVMASFDLSAPLRQGLFFIGRPKQWFSAFKEMFGAFGSEKAYNTIQENIIQDPFYKLAENRLSLTGLGSFLSKREEKFMSSWAEKIPLVGKVIRASSRAYTGFLNKLRFDVFKDLVKKAERLGLDPKKNQDLLKEIGNFINAGTGRGSLGALEKAAIPLNSFFFSPRLMASRLTLMNPVYYVKASPFVRKEALKSLFSLAGVAMTIFGLSKMAGLEVGADPRSADFGKIKIGNTRIDILGGFQQYIRLAAQLISGEIVSSTTGKVYSLGEGYKPLTRLDILERFVEYKEAPVFSFVTSILKQQDFVGKPINIPKEVGLRFVPMVIQDMIEIAKDDPSLLPLTVLGSFGVGLQTYESKSNKGGVKGNPSLKMKK